MKVSFDFDGTLEREDVQEYAKTLIKLGIEVWVVTTRYDSNHQHKYFKVYPEELWAKISGNTTGDPNFGLWGVVEKLGIPRHHVRFTCMEYKHKYLDGTKFLWHLDDNPEEFSQAKANNLKVPMIQVESNTWMEKCDKIIRIKTNELIANQTEENKDLL
jgi:hypothetical protein